MSRRRKRNENPTLAAFLQAEPTAVREVESEVAAAVRAFGLDWSMREDVAQEAMTDILEAVSKPGFRLQKSLKALVSRVTYCRCIDAVRRRARETSARSELTAMTDGLSHHARHLTHPERRRLVKQMMKGLSESNREVLVLRIYADLSHGEIAAILGITPEASRQRLVAALSQLRESYRKSGAPSSRTGS